LDEEGEPALRLDRLKLNVKVGGFDLTADRIRSVPKGKSSGWHYAG